MADRLNIYCTACRWRGKVRADQWVADAVGSCPKCSGPTVRGTPPKGGTVGRPPLSAAERLRRKAAELLAIADELGRERGRVHDEDMTATEKAVREDEPHEPHGR